MPQMDKEIFIEYFFCIFLILIQTFSNETISENFFKMNSRFFLYQFFVVKKNLFLKETFLFKNIFSPNF